MRRPFNNRRPILKPDEVYNSLMISRFINYTLKDGKKSIAKQIVYSTLENIEKNLKKPALEVFEEAIKNVSPLLEVRSRRVGGATYQVPMEVRPERKVSLAYRWILDSARSKQGKSMAEFLTEEITEAYNKTGSAMRKREEMHKAAEANKAFAHYARF
jgi:small subunit ribosomal protein S7